MNISEFCWLENGNKKSYFFNIFLILFHIKFKQKETQTKDNLAPVRLANDVQVHRSEPSQNIQIG